MNYGKNQQALLKFLQKHPNRWHRIKRRKAIDAAKRLMNRDIGIKVFSALYIKTYVKYSIPDILQEQA